MELMEACQDLKDYAEYVEQSKIIKNMMKKESGRLTG